MNVDAIKDVISPLNKATSWWYSAENITDEDYADNLSFLTNTYTKAESLLHNMARHLSLRKLR